MPEELSLALLAELEACAKQYTGCPKTADLTFDEAIEFTADQFGFLNIGEIRLAFRLAAAGEFEGVSLRAYYGTFTVGMLGEVLAAYRQYREELVKHARRMESEATEADSAEARRKAHDREQWAARRLAGLLSAETLTVEDCMAYDHDYFLESGQLQYTPEEKMQAWKDAYGLAVSEYRERAERGALGVRLVLQKVANQQHDDGFEQVRIMFAKRLLVLRWIVSQRDK